MKKLFLIPTALTACVAPTICFVGCAKTKESIFNTYIQTTDEQNLFVFDSNNYSDAVKWKDTVEFDFTFNFNIVPEDVLLQQRGKHIMLSLDVLLASGVRYLSQPVHADPDKFVFKNITYNGNKLEEGEQSSTSDCYFIDIEENGAGAGSIGFILNDFNSTSVLKVQVDVSGALCPDEPLPPNFIFSTPAIGFVDRY